MRGGRAGFQTFDYQTASDARNIIELEKRYELHNNSKKSPTISNHKASIHQKKISIAAREKTANHNYPANVRYGTIAVMGENKKFPVKCLLVDPPADANNNNARRLRLLNRMRFLADWISFVSPRSQLSAALNSRSAALETLRDPFELANTPLRRGNNDLFDLGPIDRYRHSRFFWNKAWVSDGPAGGIVARCNRDLLFLGFREDLPRIAADQDFDQLLSYRADIGSLAKTVQLQLTLRKFQDLELPDTLLPRKTSERLPGGAAEPDRFTVSLEGELHYTQEGLVFGLLPVPRQGAEISTDLLLNP